MQKKPESLYFVYMVRCKYGTYYTGYTTDLGNRIKKHNSGLGAKYLRGRSPVELVYVKEYRDLTSALRAERNIKDLTRRQKDELIGLYGKKAILYSRA